LHILSETLVWKAGFFLWQMGYRRCIRALTL
jgi:hypothetical protein